MVDINHNPDQIQSYPQIAGQESLTESARKIIFFYFQKMLACEDSTRLGDDIEALHDMRVAIRRLRAAISVFSGGFSRRVIKPFRQELKAAGGILGKVRDMDVFLEKTGQYNYELYTKEQANFAHFVYYWETERLNLRSGLLVYMDSLAYKSFKDQFALFSRTVYTGFPTGEKASVASQPISSHAAKIITAELARVLSHQDALISPTATKLHALRIDFKRLRYAIEFMYHILGSAIDQCILELKAIQDHLGNLNDANVAVRLAEEFLISQIGLPPNEKLAAEAYLGFRRDELAVMIDTFPQVWDQFRNGSFRPKLEEAYANL